MSQRFLLCPGYVISSHDAEWHYVSAIRLAHLYRVPMSECIVLPEIDPGCLGGGRKRSDLSVKVDRGELIALHPKNDGNYSLPTAKMNGVAWDLLGSELSVIVDVKHQTT